VVSNTAFVTGPAACGAAAQTSNTASFLATGTILSIVIDSATTYAFGGVVAGTPAYSTTTMDIRNVGNTPATLSLSLTNTAGRWAPVATGAPGLDQFELDGQFGNPFPAQPAPASWN